MAGTPEKSRLLTDREVAEMFRRLAGTIDPKPELEFRSVFDLLVAVVLSAQTTDKAVNQVTRVLWQTCRTPEDYLAMGGEALTAHIRSIGLFRHKCQAILGLCQALIERYHGQVPDDFEALTSLPGVGRKTANVVLNVGFSRPVLAVDTHVFRVANRTGLVSAPTPEAVEAAALPRIPKRHRLHAHHYLLLHGRYVCQARRPACATCVLADLCRQNLERPEA